MTFSSANSKTPTKSEKDRNLNWNEQFWRDLEEQDELRWTYESTARELTYDHNMGLSNRYTEYELEDFVRRLGHELQDELRKLCKRQSKRRRWNR